MPADRVRVKICGICRVEDARAAAAAGADAIGLVFYPGSRRYLEADAAAEIASAVPPFVTVVGLFLDAGPEFVQRVLRRVPLDLLQFHGSEAPKDCEAAGRPYIKAVPMAGGGDAREYVGQYPAARGFLLDSHAAGAPGGTGRAFDWRSVPADLGRPVILAGGLAPDNVAEAVRAVRPWAVDVSSGVERAPGMKDPDRIRAFLDAVTAAGAGAPA